MSQEQSNIIRVILIDDHSDVHTVVATILNTVDDIELVAQGSNGYEGLSLCEEFQPDLVLMDAVMTGIETTKQLLARMPNLRILVLSSFQDDDTVHAMLDGGAHGYILKGALAQELSSTIRATYHGSTVLSPEITQVLLHSTRNQQVKDKTSI